MSFKTFLLKLISFFILFCICDMLAGYGFRFLNARAGDKFARENYMREEMAADVIIMGSSHATHHYVPSIIADSIGLTVYNCGQRGNGIIYEYGRLATIYQRYTPKVIILDVVRSFDLDKNDNSRFLDFLKHDYGNNPTVDSLFYVIDKWSKYKMLINSYRYNSTICDLLINVLNRNRGRYRDDGYYPLEGTKISDRMPHSSSPTAALFDVDSLKVMYLERVAAERRDDCLLIYTISPSYQYVNPHEYDVVREICKKESIPLLEYLNDSGFVKKKELFYDETHLNDSGAQKFTRIVASDVKKLLKH